VEEYAAVPVLETLYASFVEKMNTLVSWLIDQSYIGSVTRLCSQVKALREQVERGFASSHVSLEYLHLAAGGSRRAVATRAGVYTIFSLNSTFGLTMRLALID
jgi:hypothetical protein